MSRAFVFPGQGSQDVGMGRALAERFAVAQKVFDEVDAALGQKLSAIMWDGPKETLTLTENAQPALMAVSVAVARVLGDQGFPLAGNVAFVAGHSLGEYSALTAAGAFSLADAARLLRLRGQAMQAAVPVGQGAMTALLGVGLEVARKIAADAGQGECCDVANDNEPTQVVLSGHKTAIDRVAAAGKPHGLRLNGNVLGNKQDAIRRVSFVASVHQPASNAEPLTGTKLPQSFVSRVVMAIMPT